MNARERFIACSIGGPVDRFFRYEHGGWPTTIERWRTEGMPDNDDWQMDPIVMLPINAGFTGTAYCPFFERTVVEETDTQIVVQDGDGVLKRVLKEHGDTSMPQFLRFPVENRGDWEKIRPRLNPDSPERYGNWQELVRKHGNPARDYPVRVLICGAYGQLRNLFGEEGLAYAIYDHPDLIHDIMENWVELYTGIFRKVTVDIPLDNVMIWEDMACRNGSLLSPRHFREFILPRYQRLTGFLRQRMPTIWVDSDGDIRELIPLFVEGGVTSVMPFEVQAGMDIVAVRKQHGSAFGIVGGIDKRPLAESRDAIDAEIDRILPFFVESGGYLPCLDHTAPPNISYANWKYYLKRLREREAELRR